MADKTIQRLFFAKAEKCGDKVAFNYFDQIWKTITYHKLQTDTKGIASCLVQKGLKKGDRVAIISENRPEWCTTYFAIALSGGIAVPLDAQLKPKEIRIYFADSEPKAIFFSSKTKENVEEAIKELFASHSSLFTVSFDSPEFNDICMTPEMNNYPEVSEEDVASLIYTSGTTGIPKGVELTHKNFCSDVEAIIKIRLVTHNDNILSVLPLHHTYPFMCTFLLPIFLGATITYPPSLKGPEIMAAMREQGVSILVGVPQLLELIRNGIINRIRQLRHPLSEFLIGILKLSGVLRKKTGINPGKLIFSSAHKALGKRFRFFASGGARLDPEVARDLEAVGFTVLEGYGLTETSPVVTFTPMEKRKAGSVGMPLPSVDIKILNPESHEPLGLMQEGEIAIRGPMVMKGYYKNPKATEQAIKDGWFLSGDLGYQDKDDYIFITGRLKEVIVLSSGKTVYPEDVEKLYMKIPLIREICVMGIEEKGIVESLHAVIVPNLEYAREAQIGNLQESLKWEINNISLHLPHYMRIKGYTIYSDPLPRTPLGKLRRFMVKDLIKVKDKEQRAGVPDKYLMEDEIGREIVQCITPLMKEKIQIQSTDNLELDLGFDSLTRIELVVSLEKAFSIKLPETFASEIQTVEELVAKIKEYGIHEVIEIKKLQWRDILKADPDFAERKKVGLHHGFFDWMIIIICLGAVKILFKLFFRLKVKGLENLPGKGPYIITPNHTSYLDGFNIVAALPSKIFKDLYLVGFQKYFTGTFREIFARLAHVIPVDPETYLNKALQLAAYVLRKEKSLVIFPEGGRSYDGEMMEFKRGVGILSIELNIPVIPASIKGSFEALPRGAKWPKFTEIEITLGEPLYPSEMDMSRKPKDIDEYQFFVNELREKVRELKLIA